MSNQQVHPAFGGVVRALSGDTARSATAQVIAHQGSGSALLAAVHQVNGEIERSRPVAEPFSEAWFAEVDRIHEQRKSDGSLDRERLERAHWEEVALREAHRGQS